MPPQSAVIDAAVDALMHQGFSRPAAMQMAAEALEEVKAKRRATAATERILATPYQKWLCSASPEYIWDKPVHKALCDHVDDIISGRIRRLAIFMPPRIGKSSAVTERLPVYWQEAFPGSRVIIGAYNRDLATLFTRNSLRLFRSRNPDAIESEAQDEWMTKAGGSVLAAGVGSGVTGRGADCLVGETLVRTAQGLVPIARLAGMTDPPPVLAFDHVTHRPVWSPVLAARRRHADSLVEIVTNGGRRLTCTPDHRVCVSGWDYEPARLLVAGDRLRVIAGGDAARDRASVILDAGPGGADVYDLQTEHHNFYAEDILVHNCLIIDDPVKALAWDTPIPTPSGYTTIEDIRVGDVVFDHAGQECTVTRVGEWVWGPRQRVWFSDGSYVDSHENHLWTALDRPSSESYSNILRYNGHNERYPVDWWSRARRDGTRYAREVETREVASTLHGRTTVRSGVESSMRNWTIPTTAPLQLPDAELPVDPYILGYWLGDGTSTGAYFTVHQDDYPSFAQAVEDAGYVVRRAEFNSGGDTTLYVTVSTIDARGGRHVDSLTRRLDDLGVLGKNAPVPTMYLRASYPQRLALLRGIMDSDGTIGNDGETSLSVINHHIADAAHELIVSLGGKATRREAVAASGSPLYIVRGFFPFNPFGLERKASRWRPGERRRASRSIVNVETLDETRHRCITVDSESHLFLAGAAMVPTHNSYEEAVSPAYQNRVWQWWQNDIRTRVNDIARTPICLILTRWHEKDLAGRILDQDRRGLWKVISFPALATENDILGRRPGESIWPERLPAEELEELKAEMGVRFEALYQQDPTPAEGGLINESWFWKSEIGSRPILAEVRAWDIAATSVSRKSGDPDWTAGVRMALIQGDNKYVYAVRDSARIRAEVGERDTFIASVALADGPEVLQIFEENDDGDKSVTHALRQVLAPHGIGVEGVKPRNDKVVRSTNARSALQRGEMFLCDGRWNYEFVSELVRFPNGRHDDQVDGWSTAYNHLIARSIKVDIR